MEYLIALWLLVVVLALLGWIVGGVFDDIRAIRKAVERMDNFWRSDSKE
jgi:uncharacterized protein YneF (UPF0154 family)